MSDPFRNYDAWLERPYQRAAEAADMFIDWCETHNIEPDDPDAEVLYQDYLDAQWEPPDDNYDYYPDDFDTERYIDDY